MIKNKETLTLAETKELLQKAGTEKAAATLNFIKKFAKSSIAEVLKLKQELKALDIAKLKEEDLVKLIDFMPGDAEDVRKIFTGSEISLDQNEIAKLLEVLKKK